MSKRLASQAAQNRIQLQESRKRLEDFELESKRNMEDFMADLHVFLGDEVEVNVFNAGISGVRGW